jgi:ABC-type Fe3+/spermidine/putrescine transport system ATPase subunit
MIRCQGLSVGFGGFRLEGIHLAVDAGESFFVLGPSGAGKTLLLEALLGVRPPEAGQVVLDGSDVTRSPPEARGVAYVPQDLGLFPHLSVRENVLFGLGPPRRRPADAAERVDRWVRLLNLGPVIGRRDVRTLSGGERQRVALARALITEPRVLFMDEPFSALDASLRRRLQVEFRRLQQQLGLTLVQVTHEPEEAFLMADRMVILMDGRVEQIGRPAELYNRPGNLRVARFLMLQNLYPARLGSRTPEGYWRLEIEGTRMTLEALPGEDFPEGSDVVVGVRPEEVILIRPDRPPDSARHRNLHLGVVDGWADLGHYRLVRLALHGLSLDAWLNIRAAREYPMEVGQEVWFHIRPWSLCLLHPEPPEPKEGRPC